MHTGFHMGTDWKGGLQADINRGGGFFSGEETYEGNLLRMWDSNGSFVTQAPHGEITLVNPATDAGSRRGRGGTYHIFSVVP